MTGPDTTRHLLLVTCYPEEGCCVCKSRQRSRGARTSPDASRWRLQAAHLFVLPYVFFLLVFGVGPGLYALVISFADFRDGTPHLFEAGLQNYVTAFTDFRFLPAFRNVLTFLLVSLPFGVIGVVALALLLHARGGWFASAMRTLYFVPGAVAGPTRWCWRSSMFDPNVSPFRILLHGMGYQNVIEVITPAHLPWIFTLIGFFADAGGWIAIFYGALNNISQEVFGGGHDRWV